jgi:GNAT superfamily N-acetyltransferase
MFAPDIQMRRRAASSPAAAADIRIQAATVAQDWRAAHAIITEHIEWISASLGIEYADAAQPSLHGELATIARFYTPPHGQLFLARLDGAPAGTVGVVRSADGIAELKRLYVRPIARRHHLGEALVRAALRAAATFDCHTIRLSTLPGLMDTAIAIYRRLGFRETAPFGDVALPGLLYLARQVPPLGSAHAA